MRVLLTGSDGYLGAVVGPMLATAGHDVVGLDTGYFEDCHHGPAPATATKPVDLRDVAASVCDGLDAVVHLGALSNDPLGNLDAELTHAINTEATLRLARLARDAGVARFVFSSSCSIYGASGGDDIMDEDAPMRPVTPYAESKVRVEEGLHELADDSFTPISLRNATAYGWSPRLRLDLVLNDLVASALLTGEVRVLSDGTPWRPIVHARDIGGAFCAALDAPLAAVHDRAFNVGFTNENYQVRDLAEIVAGVLKGSRVVITAETGPDPRSYRVDFSRAATAFPGWAQEWDARRGARDLVERFAEFGLAAEDRVRFSRVAWLTALRKAGRLSSTLRWERSGGG